MSYFNIFSGKYLYASKSSNIEGNTGHSASHFYARYSSG